MARFGDRESLVSCQQGVRLTYADLDARVNRLAAGLLTTGIAKGDRVGMRAPNCVEWVLVQYAAAKVGAILVNLNPAYQMSELEYALRQSGTRLLFSARSFRTSDCAATVGEVRGGLAALEAVVFLDELDTMLADDRDAVRARMAELTFDDPVDIQDTSGTTGFPKGATLSHHNILNNGYFVGELCGYTEADRVCVPVPFSHCFGMVMGNLACTSRGACIVVPAPVFEPEATLAAVAEERCTSLYGVPTMFIAELDHPRFAEFDLTALRTGIMAGSPCPVELMKRVALQGPALRPVRRRVPDDRHRQGPEVRHARGEHQAARAGGGARAGLRTGSPAGRDRPRHPLRLRLTGAGPTTSAARPAGRDRPRPPPRPPARAGGPCA